VKPDKSLSLTLDFAPQGGGGVVIHWQSEVLDGAFTAFTTPYSAADLPAVIKALDMLQLPQPLGGDELATLERHGLLRDGFIHREAPEIIGRALYDALGQQGVGLLERVIGHARNTGSSISYSLRFPPSCVDLAALPWELLRRPNHYVLMRSDGLDSCERTILFGEPPPAPLPDSQLPHVLVLLPHFAIAEAEREAHIEIFAALQRRGALTFDVISPLTTARLSDYCRTMTRRPHIVHYAGHGAYSDQKGWLLFDGAGHNTQRVSAEQFSALIGPVHLAVIEACQSAMVAEGELLTGIAPALSYAAGAVIAMRLTVLAVPARRFIAVLYEQLLVKAQPLRVAVTRARRDLFVDADGASWYVPVLYLRVPPQFARDPTSVGRDAGARKIVATPVRQVVIPPAQAGMLKLSLAQDVASGHWRLQAHNQDEHEVEAITVSTGRMPPGVQLHPPVMRIPRAPAGETSAPETVNLTSLAVVRADGDPATPLALSGLETSVAGPAQWAPQGGRFAAIIGDQSSAEVLISDGVTEAPSRIRLVQPVAPRLAPAAWAPGGNYLVVINDNYGSPALQLVDVQQSRAVTVPLALGDLATATWRPQRDELLVTALSDDAAPALRIVTPDGQVQPFEPEDGQYSRRQGAWSPDGSRVAYIATATLTDTTQTVLLVNADGTSPGVLVPDGENFMPVWAPRGDLVFFTRRDSDSDGYTLYRVQPDGQGIQQVGRGLPPEFVAFDPRSAIAWSPDGTRMFFQSLDPNTNTFSLSVADYDGSNPRVITSGLNSGGSASIMHTLWSPTSRGVLMATWGSEMRFQWLTREEPETFPEGGFPNWEP